MPLRISESELLRQDSVESKLRERIRMEGRISFADFMDMALYDPEGGYYVNRSRLADSHDYFTSPTAHPCFGALFAVQLERMWEVLGRPEQFHAVEIGAGSGLLARDVTEYAAGLSADFARSLRYVSIDRFPSCDSDGVETIASDRVPLNGVVGCFLSNELVDAFPVHRFRVDGGRLREVFVGLDEKGQLTELVGDPSTDLLLRVGARLRSLPDGFCGEVNRGISAWMGDVAGALERGFVVTVDYGSEADLLYSAAYVSGTVQTYYSHTQGGSPYRRIGRQDITAHVDFTAMMDEGRAVGLSTLGYMTQRRLLEELGIGRMLESLRTADLPQRERDDNRMAMMEVIKPDGLGAFKVLVQEKATGVVSLDELRPGDERVSTLVAPLLQEGRLKLMEARYPHLAWQPPPF